MTRLPSLPSHWILMDSGTRSQISPVASTPTISVEPMPVPKQPKAPAVTVWESTPTNSVPGRSKQFSARIWWQGPHSSK